VCGWAGGEEGRKGSWRDSCVRALDSVRESEGPGKRCVPPDVFLLHLLVIVFVLHTLFLAFHLLHTCSLKNIMAIIEHNWSSLSRTHKEVRASPDSSITRTAHTCTNTQRDIHTCMLTHAHVHTRASGAESKIGRALLQGVPIHRSVA
jgi:hypothetical protein